MTDSTSETSELRAQLAQANDLLALHRREAKLLKSDKLALYGLVETAIYHYHGYLPSNDSPDTRTRLALLAELLQAAALLLRDHDPQEQGNEQPGS